MSTRTRPLRLTRCTLWPPVVGSRPRAFTLGLLYAEERRAVDTARLRFVAVWPEVSRKRWRRWLSEA